jgi:hypothetical protein
MPEQAEDDVESGTRIGVHFSYSEPVPLENSIRSGDLHVLADVRRLACTR